ncbi:unnamed protein product, partial [Adineta steineri]
PASCFYGKDQVELVHGEKRSIENLVIGDRVWSITPDGNSLIEDEIIMMMHNEPNISASFYTFKTIEGYEVSLTDRHNIPVFDSKENQIKIKRSSLVRQEDYLLMYNRKIKIENISINTRIGFYSPLTLTGYLLVNNISTSVFSDSYKTSSNTIQLGFLPIRLYYRLARMIYGKSYNPFGDIQYGLHPVAKFYKDYQKQLRFWFHTSKYILPTILIYFIMNFFEKTILPKLQKIFK